MLLPVHIAAGGLAIVLGGLALAAAKGGWLHRRAGLVFVGAMALMGSTGAAMAFSKGGLTNPNVFAGGMAVYFVLTAWMTVRPASPSTRLITAAAMTMALGIAFCDAMFGTRALRNPGGTLDGVPFAMYFFMGGVLLLAALGDARVLAFGVPRGSARLARHLWRMCFALFIAAGSFFSLRERVAAILPEPFTSAPLRILPILLPFAAMLYWLWRVRRRPMPSFG